MISLRRSGVTLAVLAAALLMSSVVPTVDAGMPRARAYHAGGAIGLDTNLLSLSGTSAWAIDEYLKATTSLPPLGTAFIAAEKRYGVNARFLLAAAMHESAWGTGYISRRKHNLFGHNAFDRDPLRFATAFATYAASIDSTARFIKEAYLTPHGRWWGGRPTLRSMQQFWSSSHRWGIGVSRIATSIHLHSLASRSIRFVAPMVSGPLKGQSQALVVLGWAGGAIPASVKFVATWERIGLDAPVVAGTIPSLLTAGSGVADALAPVAASAGVSLPLQRPNAAAPTGPTSAAARRVRTGARSITVAVPAPREAGRYLLGMKMVDSDGGPLPAAEQIDIPGVDVRVWSDRAVGYDLAPNIDGTGVVLRITNTGLVAIPAAPDRNSFASRDPDAMTVRSVVTLTASANDPANPLPVQLLSSPLITGLLPGASVSFDVPGIAAATGRTTNWLSANLSVLGDPTWLEARSPAGAWLWTAQGDERAPTGTEPGNAPAPSKAP